MHRYACPICQSQNQILLRGIEIEIPIPYPLSRGFNVAVCGACGFGYLDEVASQAEYDEYYRSLSKYEDKKVGIGLGLYREDAERSINIAQMIASVATDKNARLIDIGCANGGLLNQLAQMGYTDVTGMDPSPVCVANCKELFGVKAINGSLFSPPADAGKFDVLILCHVVEHIADLERVVPAVKHLLKDDGIAYIEAPDACLYAEALLAPLQEFNTEHINYFSLEHLIYLFGLGGMTVINSGKRRTPAQPNDSYPVVHAFFTPSKSGDIPAPKPPSMVGPLAEYIEKSEAWMARMDEQFERELAGVDSFSIWGAGQLLMKLLKLPSLRDRKIDAIVDTNSVNYGKLLRGVPVSAPETLLQTSGPILISTVMFKEEIEEQIRAMLKGADRPILKLAEKP